MWQRYQNELIVFGAFLIMIMGYGYKSSQISSQAKNAVEMTHNLAELKKVVALKALWSDKRTSAKVEKFATIVPISKVKWSNKSKKVTAFYTNLTPQELNTVVTKILNLPVEITKLTLNKINTTYSMEFKCKW